MSLIQTNLSIFNSWWLRQQEKRGLSRFPAMEYWRLELLNSIGDISSVIDTDPLPSVVPGVSLHGPSIITSYLDQGWTNTHLSPLQGCMYQLGLGTIL